MRKQIIQEPITLSETDKQMIPLNKNFNFISEAVVHYALEKIIINSAHLLFLGDMHEVIPDHCEESIFRILDCTTKLEFLQYDKDDLNINQENKEENREGVFEIVDNPSNRSLTIIKNRPLMLDDYIENINNWDAIDMPGINPIDREACSTIKVEKISKNLNINSIFMIVSPIKEVKEENSKDINRNKPKPAVRVVTNPLTISTGKKPGKDKEKERDNSKNQSENNDEKDDDKSTNYKGLKYTNYIDENYPKEEPLKIIELRKELENKMKKINEDLKNKEKTVKTSANNNKENEKKLKELEGKNRTADAEGKFILIKPTLIDKLPSDFIIPNTNVAYRPSSSVEEQKLNNPIVQKQNLKVKDDVSVKGDEHGSPERDFSKKPTLIGKKKLKKGFEPVPIPSMKIDSFPIIPAGSSYEMIVPEEGVTILEGKKKKGGTTNFLKAFNKHSKYDYMTMLRETIGANSLRDTMEHLMGSNKEDEKKSKEVGLPAIISERNLKDNLNFSPSLKQKTVKENKDKFQVSKGIGTTLKIALDSLTVDDKINKMAPQENSKNTNLFKTKSKFRDTGMSIFGKTTVSNSNEDYNNTMNNFNQSILTNSNWGTLQGLTGNNRKFNMTMDMSKRIKKNKNEINFRRK